MTEELRKKIDAEGCINFLQNVMAGKIKGVTLKNRIDAATTLLKKTLPDCRQTEIMTEYGRTYEDDIEEIWANKDAKEAKLGREEELSGFLKGT